MTNRRCFLLGLGSAIVLADLAQADPAILTAKQANDRLQQGRLILIDVRTPEEWRGTGVAAGAWPMDMTDPAFGPGIVRAIGANPDHDIAVICRTGRRSAYVVEVLAKNGITGVLDVSEGMAGGRNGRGWIPSGLPTVSAEEALAGMPADLTVR